MEKRGICAHVIHGFAVFPEAKAEGENQKRVGYGMQNTTRYHGVTNLYYTACACAVSILVYPREIITWETIILVKRGSYMRAYGPIR